MRRQSISILVFCGFLVACGDETQFSSDYLNTKLKELEEELEEQEEKKKDKDINPELPQVTQDMEEPEDDGQEPETELDNPLVLTPVFETPPFHGENLIINGDFSYPKLHKFWNLFSEDELDFEKFGWNFSFIDDNACQTDMNTAYFELQRRSKDNQIAELDSHCRGSSLSSSAMRTSIYMDQEVSVPAGVYLITFEYKDRRFNKNNPNELEFFLNEESYQFTSVGTWTTVQFELEIFNDQETIHLGFADLGTPDTYGILIDSVTLAPIMEE